MIKCDVQVQDFSSSQERVHVHDEAIHVDLSRSAAGEQALRAGDVIADDLGFHAQLIVVEE